MGLLTNKMAQSFFTERVVLVHHIFALKSKILDLNKKKKKFNSHFGLLFTRKKRKMKNNVLCLYQFRWIKIQGCVFHGEEDK